MRIAVYGKAVPLTAANFLGLCAGDHGETKAGTKLQYVGTNFHRIIYGFMAQGGGYQRSGRGREQSIWGGAFADESFCLSHDDSGVLSMANAGPNTNRAQFFITFKEQVSTGSLGLVQHALVRLCVCCPVQPRHVFAIMHTTIRMAIALPCL